MINNTTTVDSYWATTGTQDYLVTIEFLDTASNLYVAILDHVTGLESIPTYTEGVATTGEFSYDSATGKITLGDTVTGVGGSISDSDKITITTNLAYLQKTDITSNSNYDPEVLESAYDNAVLLTRQNRDTINRSMTLSVSDTGQTMELPSKTALANSYLHFDSNGNPEEHVGILPRVYDGEFPYLVNDIVPYGGTFWICITDSTGNTPISGSTYWEVFTDRSNEWNPDINYNTGVAAWYGDVYYKSLQNPNLGNTPVGGTGDTFWQEVNLYGTRWDSGVNYAINDISSISGTLIRSKVDDNMGNPPDITPGATDNFWEVVKTGGAVIVEGETGSAGFSALDLVYFDNGSDDGDITGDAGKLVKADKGSLDKAIITGFALTTGVSTDIVEVQSKGLLSGFVGLTPGERYYLGDAGGYCTRGSVDYQDYLVSVGVAKSSDTMDVNIGLPEATRNQDDGNPVGSIKYFSTYKDRSAYGYLPFAFDNAISQANYSALYNEIGNIYEAQHVAAGDLASGAGMFYPTPIPGAYDRVGIPDSNIIDSTSGIDTSLNKINIGSEAWSSFKLLNTERKGMPFKFKVISGSLPTATPVYDESTIYYMNFAAEPLIYTYPTEADAIANTNKIDITATAVGTFRLTQEGIVLDDAFQGHKHNIQGHVGTAGSEDAVLVSGSRLVNYKEGIVRNPTTDGTNGTPRTTNETRPKTNYSFGYIKAEHVTSAGEPISALRDSQPWVEFTGDWTNHEFIVTPQPAMGYSNIDDVYDLQVEIWLADDATPTNPVKIIEFTRSTGTTFTRGLSIMPNNNTSFKIQTAVDGVYYLSDTGTATLLSTSNTGAYKVVITKPNLVNTVFDVSSMPKTYDLTSANVTVTLPVITGAMQTKSIYWTNGGTYKLSLAVTDAATVGGLTAATWEGEGEGHILLESDGSNWQVREYEDSGSIVDSGSNVRRTFRKNEREMVIRGVYESVSTTSTAYGSLYQSNLSSFSFGKSFASDGIISARATASYHPNILSGVSIDSTPSVNSINFYVIGGSSTTVGDVTFELNGYWY